MKKNVSSLKSLVFLMGVVLSIGAFGETVYSVNVGGLLKVDSKSTNTVVGVPWVFFNTNGVTNIDIATLVKTRNLVPGDIVRAVDPDGQRIYEAWSLNAEGHWEPATTVKRTTERQIITTEKKVSERQYVRGIGLWVIRCGVGSDVLKPFYLGGQYESSPVVNTILGGSAGAPAWTLLSNPFDEELDLTTDVNWFENYTQGDEVFIVDAAGNERYYHFKEGQGWGRTETTKEKGKLPKPTFVKGCKVGPGCAFWYIRTGASFEIEWKKK